MRSALLGIVAVAALLLSQETASAGHHRGFYGPVVVAHPVYTPVFVARPVVPVYYPPVYAAPVFHPGPFYPGPFYPGPFYPGPVVVARPRFHYHPGFWY
jgi:hypothetical protein